MEANIKDVAIKHIKRDTNELVLLSRAFEKDSAQSACIASAVSELKQLLALEGVTIE